jgi:hypothetical protein
MPIIAQYIQERNRRLRVLLDPKRPNQAAIRDLQRWHIPSRHLEKNCSSAPGPPCPRPEQYPGAPAVYGRARFAVLTASSIGIRAPRLCLEARCCPRFHDPCR